MRGGGSFAAVVRGNEKQKVQKAVDIFGKIQVSFDPFSSFILHIFQIIKI